MLMTIGHRNLLAVIKPLFAYSDGQWRPWQPTDNQLLTNTIFYKTICREVLFKTKR